MGKRIVISFKNNEVDNELYKEICEASDKSAYVKDILKEYKKLKKDKEQSKRKRPNLNF
jgi:hypothetical protein